MLFQSRELPHFVILYAAIYAAFGVTSPFWPRFFEARGLAPEQIGLLFGLATMVRLTAGPCAGRVADLLGTLRAVLAVCAFIAAGAALGLFAVNGFWPLLLIHACQAAALAPITILADALALSAAAPRHARRRGFEYGFVRGSASAAFIVGVLAAGETLASAGFTPIIWTHAALLVAAAVGAAFVPAIEADSRIRTHERGSAFAGVRELFGMPAFRRLVLVAALIYGSHAMHDAFAIIRWNAAGIGSTSSSILWSEAVAAEVIVFFVVGPRLVNLLDIRGAVALAATAGVVRWIVMAQSTNVAVLALVQPLHGLTFALTHLACMRLIASTVPPHLAATAQALYMFGPGIATALLTTLSGQLYAQFGPEGFLVMAFLCGAAIPVSLGLRVEETPSR